MDSHPTLGSLPNELLISILTQVPTASLLPLITVSHRFYSVTLRIFKQRLNHATAQPDHRLMLECYHPTDKLYTPYLYCNYLHTDSLDGVEAEAEGAAEQQSIPPPVEPKPTHLGGLRGIYSHFRPVEHDENPRRRTSRRPPRQGISSSGGQAHAGQQQQRSVLRPPTPEQPSIDIYLDDDESFSQLCATTNLVRMGPRPGLFRSHVNVSDGVVRVWRDWLAVQAARAGHQQREGEGEGEGDDDHGNSAVLWADAARDVGVRFRVAEKDLRGQHQQPVLVARDEQLPVAYRLGFEELLVRSTTLLVMMEKSEVQEVTAEGKAIVLASF
ncbi:hypothetical protein C8A00DRAFT_44746 [Chaetomidium leptoderma]|uniref:F-box domain-containing protein n=1 Tax=Chaetomidium leptoderma TaxID=669021 RepID=A0AAN6ZV78_9PEZI|nr:hypothetical protein C8A00DRAFT_44746 [Chaetomidium leptoderma]